MKQVHLVFAAVIGILVVIGCSQLAPRGGTPQGVDGGPKFVVDPFWPKPLKGNWIFGQMGGLAVDSRDHVWILHRPATLAADEKGAQQQPPLNRCCTPAPAVMEFDRDGNFVQGWGGPGQGYDWPKSEHGIHVDAEGNVWIAGNDNVDNMVLKFTRDGKLLMQIGKPGKSEGSNSRAQLGRPAHMEVDAAANEVFIADGYGNRRVIVFDAKTGAYKRHWGAYGEAPQDGKQEKYSPLAAPSRQFSSPSVHCVRLSKDGLVYVCDRYNNRVQVFRKNGAFVKEFFVERETLGAGVTTDLVFSPDAAQRYLYLADGPNSQIHILSREDGRVLASFARPGRYAGEFRSLHNLGIDSRGNLYTAEAGAGRRVQKFVLTAN